MTHLSKLIFHVKQEEMKMNLKVQPPASSIFAYGNCLSFFFLLSFDISSTQIATIDPSKGTILCVCVCCNKLFISFHFNVLNEPLKSVYISCRVDYKIGLSFTPQLNLVHYILIVSIQSLTFSMLCQFNLCRYLLNGKN